MAKIPIWYHIQQKEFYFGNSFELKRGEIEPTACQNAPNIKTLETIGKLEILVYVKRIFGGKLFSLLTGRVIALHLYWWFLVMAATQDG